jgi:hypothetical protein
MVRRRRPPDDLPVRCSGRLGRRSLTLRLGDVEETLLAEQLLVIRSGVAEPAR